MSDSKRTSPAPHVVEEIDRNLRKAFGQLAEEPLPDRFTDLLAQLRAVDSKKEGDVNDR
ncbi:NepR family anti-sigma factor [Phaeobacter sp. HF9A]|uniref:NepR family anti-sigma factor n=1 Tax=Phaeobacter sp. HF9A TaxID=2721561 RepID=UPI0014309022|nr:NepR family anti-sigma factor [Phaeobacter sp. HF9A]NIZ12079.1 hypothetical protein [Phaeobacter sp. HF9A]